MVTEWLNKGYSKELIWELLEAREKAERDRINRLFHAREEGRREGLREVKLEVARRLRDLGVEPGLIEQVTGLTLAQLE